MVIFTDEVVAALGDQIAARPPEVGGALLGVPCSNVVTRFVADPGAETTTVSYLPTPALRARVRDEEARSGLEFRGVVHSHPGAMNHPSQADGRALQIGLTTNPHLPHLVAPIITVDRSADQEDETQLSLSPRGRLTCYLASRSVPDGSLRSTANDGDHPDALAEAAAMGGSVRLEKAMIGVMPIGADLARSAQAFADAGWPVLKVHPGYRRVNGVLFISRALSFETGELILLLPPHYPISPPIAFVALRGDPNPQQVSFPWMLANSGERLAGCRESAIKLLQSTMSGRVAESAASASNPE